MKMTSEVRMMSRLAALLIVALVFLGTTNARAAGDEGPKPEPQSWSFGGIFGYYDRGALQRGHQVYAEVCSSCHAMKYVSYRNLGQEGGPGFSEAEVKAIAAEYEVTDGPNADGEMFTRPAIPSDQFASPFANDQEARSANGGALPVDLSLIAKARGIERGFPWWLVDVFTGYQEQGVDYVYGLLIGYEEPPADFALQDGMNYNQYFAGHQIAMPAPLSEDSVEYADGTPATVEQMAKDVSTYLMWAAEPHLEARKRMGFQVMIFLSIFAVLLYLTKRKIWARIEH